MTVRLTQGRSLTFLSRAISSSKNFLNGTTYFSQLDKEPTRHHTPRPETRMPSLSFQKAGLVKPISSFQDIAFQAVAFQTNRGECCQVQTKEKPEYCLSSLDLTPLTPTNPPWSARARIAQSSRKRKLGNTDLGNLNTRLTPHRPQR
jgi:hypothetical protein